MTVAIGKKFGDRIVIASDTMITNSNGTRNEIIPGKLKAIVLSSTISVAFANHANQAIEAIRKAKYAVEAGGGHASVIDILCSEPSADFLVASHLEGGPKLQKITAGAISNDLAEAWIGNPEAVRMVSKAEAVLGQTPSYPSMAVTTEELHFCDAFHSLFLDQGVSLTQGVGGIPIFLLASPKGHTYNGYAMTMRWDEMEIRSGSGEKIADLPGGITSWTYSVTSPSLRGVAAIGVSLPQACIGFVYLPLDPDWDEGLTKAPARLVKLPPGESGISRHYIDHISEHIPGGVPEPDEPAPASPQQFDFSFLEAIARHAASSKHRTTVTLDPRGLWVSCKSPAGGQSSLIDKSDLRPENLDYILRILDYLNAATEK